MSDSLADLFSASSPPRPRTPSPAPQTLFLSPGDTPQRAPPEASTSRVDLPIDDINWEPETAFETAFVDPLAVDDQPVKKRRVVAKVDEERLLGPYGFPALIRAAKRFKVRGKNRETEDLRELLSVYQMWAHGMFPKGDFHSTIARVEVVCRKRRMESAMKGYRDAFYPPPDPSPSPQPDALGALDDSQVPERAFNLPSSEPLFGPDSPGPDAPDVPDMDELMAMEEMEQRQPDSDLYE